MDDIRIQNYPKYYLQLLQKNFDSPKLTAMLKYLMVSKRCLDSATDPVIKLRTDLVPAFLRNLTIYFLLVYQLDAFLVPDRSEDGGQHNTLSFTLG